MLGFENTLNAIKMIKQGSNSVPVSELAQLAFEINSVVILMNYTAIYFNQSLFVFVSYLLIKTVAEVQKLMILCHQPNENETTCVQKKKTETKRDI